MNAEPSSQPARLDSGNLTPVQEPPRWIHLDGPSDLHDGPYRTTNGYAVMSFVCGLLWGFGVLSVFAILYGHEALRQCKTRGQDGAGIAVGGLILGYLGILPALILVFGGFGAVLT